MPSKPSKPGKPIKRPRRSLKLTDEQLQRCQQIADAHTVFGVTPSPLAVAAEALKRGLEGME